jgi:hypothetical protein
MTVPKPICGPRVIYIAGIAHSGSTLLDILIGASPSVTSLGQVATTPAVATDRTCSCQASVQDCPLWSTVVGETWLPSDTPLMVRDERLLAHIVFRTDRYSTYKTRQHQISQRISAVLDTPVYVDSSKNISHGLVVGDVADCTYLHLVRRPSSVADSYNRRRVERGLRERRFWPRARWFAKNCVIAIALRASRRNRLVVCHEWLEERPIETMRLLSERLRIEPPAWTARRPPMVSIGGHIASGGRVRQSQEVEVASGPLRAKGLYRWYSNRSLRKLVEPAAGRSRAGVRSQ